MKLSKTIIIGGITTTIVIIGLGTILVQNNQEKGPTMEEQIQADSDSTIIDWNKVADDIDGKINDMVNEIEGNGNSNIVDWNKVADDIDTEIEQIEGNDSTTVDWNNVANDIDGKINDMVNEIEGNGDSNIVDWNKVADDIDTEINNMVNEIEGNGDSNIVDWNKVADDIDGKINDMITLIISKSTDKKANNLNSNSCVDACTKYKKCASYTDGATIGDQQDAYNSCSEECNKWSDTTKICINKKPINAAIDCMNLSVCAMKEYMGK